MIAILLLGVHSTREENLMAECDVSHIAQDKEHTKIHPSISTIDLTASALIDFSDAILW